jgi:hypothetical protein
LSQSQHSLKEEEEEETMPRKISKVKGEKKFVETLQLEKGADGKHIASICDYSGPYNLKRKREEPHAKRPCDANKSVGLQRYVRLPGESKRRRNESWKRVSSKGKRVGPTRAGSMRTWVSVNGEKLSKKKKKSSKKKSVKKESPEV